MVKVLVQELKETKQFENARMAIGVQFAIPEGQTAAASFAFAYTLAIPQLRYRFDQLFGRTKKTPLPKESKMECPAGAVLFAGLSQLVSVSSFENVRVDAEFAATPQDGESFLDCWDRAFEEVGKNGKRAIEHMMNGSDGAGARDGDGKAKTFQF